MDAESSKQIIFLLFETLQYKAELFKLFETLQYRSSLKAKKSVGNDLLFMIADLDVRC